MPLLIVSPIPNRVIFNFCFAVCGIIVVSADYLAMKVSPSVVRVASITLKIGICAFVFSLLLSFYNIRWLDQIRTSYIEQQVSDNASEIDIFEIPYDYVYSGSGPFMYGRRYYRREWGDIAFHVQDFDTWMVNNYPSLQNK